MSDVDVAPWLASLPLAPVFRPSADEFADPIAYILKIEKEASQFGICKIVPPLTRAAEETALANLNLSLAAPHEGSSASLSRSMCSAVGEGDARVVSSGGLKFTTRRQQLGWNPRKPRGGSQYRAQKLVWESGEYYTLEQFQEKARSFSSAVLGAADQPLTPLDVETLFWNAEFAKPVSVEYANDIPGSAFVDSAISPALDLASSRWNVRNIARSHGSLLRFLTDEVPGVTTPMVYLGMLFSWFAWHVEDHELHSLNYLHTGARKTWYAVPSDAATALEEVIRLYGYGSRLKPRAAFTLLGEKTTILSPEVLVAAGVPCCRLVQDPGEYVITFPRAYHLGFSHGFNCGEAANFATPAWLDLAREAAARRASMNHLPMLSHEQLLYLLTLSLPKLPSPENHILTSRVEGAVKSAFVNELKQNNVAISKLRDFGVEDCVFLKVPLTLKPRKEAADNTRLAGQEEAAAGDTMSAPAGDVCVESRAFSPDRYDALVGDVSCIARLPTPWGALPCAACGILCFASMALVQPTSASNSSSRQRKQKATAVPAENVPDPADTSKADPKPALPDKGSLYSGICQFNSADGADCDMLPESSCLSDDNVLDIESPPQTTVGGQLDIRAESSHLSSLELLADTYKEDSEEECGQCEPDARPDGIISKDEVGISTDAPWVAVRDDPGLAESDRGACSQTVQEPGTGPRPLADVFVSKGLWVGGEQVLSRKAAGSVAPATSGDPVCSFNCESNNLLFSEQDEDCPVLETAEATEVTEASEAAEATEAAEAAEPKEDLPPCVSNDVSPPDSDTLKANSSSFMKGSARPYVFCIEHALEAVTALQSAGGASVLIICHPNYDVMQQRAEELAVNLKLSLTWDQVPLREASEVEVDILNRAIHLKLDSSVGVNWSARMGIGSRKIKKKDGILDVEQKKQSDNLESETLGFPTAKAEADKKQILGKWCGKQWKASQVHPLLGGGKSTANLLGQMLRRCELQKRLPLKIRNSLAGLASFSSASITDGPLKKIRKDGWDPQERVLTAAILRKSKRNAATRDGRRKRIKYDGIQARLQQTSSTLTQYGMCKQAVFASECNTNEALDDESQGNKKDSNRPTLSNPASSSTTGGCQKNLNSQSDLDSTALVKWHDVPVSCSPSLRPTMQVYSEWSSDQTAICSTSHQDTAFDDMQAWDQVKGSLDQSKKLVLRFKRKCAESPALSKRSRLHCVENSSDELNNVTEQSPESYSGLCETSVVDYNCAQSVEDNAQVPGSDGAESGSDFDEYSLKTGSGSDSSPPKALPCFGTSKKRSASKTRVKRATWDSLLNRLTVPQKDEELTLLNQDSFPLSCVTETGWDGFECKLSQSSGSLEKVTRGAGGTYRPKVRAETTTPPTGGSKQKAKRGGKGSTAAAEVATQDDLDDQNNPFPCDIEGCTMSFNSEQELVQHKKNRCTFKGCGKRFFSHKYLVQHRRVHVDDRPLKCPWQGCTMSFKWAWARTEHIRVHTGERPYACPDCDKTFRFVSDFSRHKRNTGHARA